MSVKRTVLSLLGFTAGLVSNAEVQPKKPDVFLITADDLGLQLGCYGDHTVPTPHLDAFAAGSVKFTRAYVASASCSPSRSAILTGLYPHQNGQLGLVNNYSMKAGLPNLTVWMKQNGYFTAILGKLHVLPESDFLFDQATMTPAQVTRDVRKMAETAADLCRQSAERPAFLYINYFDPHEIAGEPTGFTSQFKGIPEHVLAPSNAPAFPFTGFTAPEIQIKTAGYYNSVARLDAGIGMLIDTLKAQHRWDDALVIFIGDNGPPFTRAKTTCYEGGLHVPMIVKFPGNRYGGTVEEALTSAVDIVPTILRTIRADVPENLPGIDLGALLGGDRSLERRHVFGEFSAHLAKHFYPRRSVSDGRYKLVYNLQYTRPNPLPQQQDGAADIAEKMTVPAMALKALERLKNSPEYELYDLKKDPWEFDDLSAQPEYEPILKTLKMQIQQWRKQTDDPVTAQTVFAEFEKQPEKPKGDGKVQ